MRTAVTVPDDLYEQVELLVARSGRSRSEVYTRALREYVLRRRADDVTAALDAVIAEIPDNDAAFLREAARRTLGHAEA